MLNDEDRGGGLSEAVRKQKKNNSTIPDRPKYPDILTSPDINFSEDEVRIQRPVRLLKKSFVTGSGEGREGGLCQ